MIPLKNTVRYETQRERKKFPKEDFTQVFMQMGDTVLPPQQRNTVKDLEVAAQKSNGKTKTYPTENVVKVCQELNKCRVKIYLYLKLQGITHRRDRKGSISRGAENKQEGRKIIPIHMQI